ncbi:hypothetical protein [Sphingomonas hengshuiensis]|uniref:Rap1a immunity protein domain-containing protein n=1 Tax=Sphingomonas hengshuiensis TaxID=1609977 RepID=A0A7U4J8Y6_9SPHN|nr:hypothetical protein [Sphingomonas hengshuiensis]AJP72438.1 hypothetical protein TS85_12570 [Sphingomonas hengshuiensis]
MKAIMLLAAILAPASVSATPTDQFIARWEAASRAPKQPGVTAEQALATPELKALVEEFFAVANEYRRQILEARAAGTPPRACPPKSLDLSIDTVLADIRSLPTTWQSRDFADSFGAALDKRYPCSANAQNT